MRPTVASTPLVPGLAAGPALVLAAPLSLWGGVDPATGSIVDPRHPDRGRVLAGSILVMPAARGSSSSSSVLAELLRSGIGPLAIVLGEADEILVVGAVVARELYGAECAVVQVSASDYAEVASWTAVEIDADGLLRRLD